MLNSTLVSGSYSPRVSKKKIRKKWAVSRWCNFDQYYFKIMIFVVISFNATFPSVFWEEGGGGGGEEVEREKRLCTTPTRTERSLTGTRVMQRFLNKP